MSEEQITPTEEQSKEQQTPLQEQPKDDHLEDEARAMGWKPKEEYKGDPEHWISAERYVERGKEKLPVLRETLSRTTDDNIRMRKELKELKFEIDSFGKMHTEALESQRKMLLADIEEQQERAFDDGDKERWESLKKKKEQITEAYSPKQPERKEQTEAQQVSREDSLALAKFERDNPWFTRDTYLNRQANVIFGELRQSRPEMSMTEALREVERSMFTREDLAGEMQRWVPQGQQRGEPPKNGGGLPKVAGTKQVAESRTAKTYNDLPAAAKAACDAQVRFGIITKDKYVKSYFGE